jgi:hypothetical protein
MAPPSLPAESGEPEQPHQVKAETSIEYDKEKVAPMELT